MPYKEKTVKSQRQKERRKGEAPQEVKPLNEAPVETVPASYVQGLEGRMYQSLPARPRFLTLSDGQVLDRLNQPIAERTKIHQIRVSNESCYNFHPSEGKITKELGLMLQPAGRKYAIK